MSDVSISASDWVGAEARVVDSVLRSSTEAIVLLDDAASITSSTAPAAGRGSSLTVTGVQAGATTITITCTIKIDP